MGERTTSEETLAPPPGQLGRLWKSLGGEQKTLAASDGDEETKAMSHITLKISVLNNKAVGFECQKIHKLVDEATKQVLLAPFFFIYIKKPRNDIPKLVAGVTAPPQTGRRGLCTRYRAVPLAFMLGDVFALTFSVGRFQ